MKIPVISTGDKVTGTTNTFSLSPTFTTGGNAKFHLEVSKNKDVIFFFRPSSQTSEFYHLGFKQLSCKAIYTVSGMLCKCSLG